MSNEAESMVYAFGPARLRFLTCKRRASEPVSYFIDLDTDHSRERIQIYISPTGKRVRVWRGNTELT